MPEAFEVSGLQDLARLSSALRAAGEQGKGLRRELTSGLTRETKETRAEMRAAILPGLPKRGGLAADVLRSTRFTSSVSTGRDPAVRIRARGKRSIRRMNDYGVVRHPIFGKRDVWVSQTHGVRLGLFSKPFKAARPALQRAAVQAIARTRAEIYRRIG